ncbi:Eukaryotic translation initiation factor 3 subunit I [Microtus ochrogaster]|uniref:Eukaryotic translation initiation factor 3 subunit I n=1 Tax=Microtus ochrogaster TaxID=79684 RepID=A0A8J6L043_MICOH|nr:Eukaryotic translation initiation factor 3 subunit I [Microtus ochrogaster]
MDADWDTKHFLTGSTDNSCCLWDCETGKQLNPLKTNLAIHTHGFNFGGNIIMLSTDKQMISAFSIIYDHVVLGGGQEAMDITIPSTRIGKFEARFFHLAFEEEFGRVKGHFGRDGKSYSSGGKDGYVHILFFDPQK